MKALLDEIDRLAQEDPQQFALQRESVSKWSVAEQLDHAIRVCSAILLKVLEPSEIVPQKLNWIGRLVLLAGYIPRGKGKSPKAFLPVPCSQQQLRQSVGETRALLDRVLAGRSSESSDRIVRHPLFGGLTAKEALVFANIHTRHHLAIVRDILAARV